MVLSGAYKEGVLPEESKQMLTPMPLRRDESYQAGFQEAVDRWRSNPSIEPNLYVHPETQLPYAAPLTKGYPQFKELFKNIYSERKYGVWYKGVYAVTEDNYLRVSPANPSLVKHGMLTGGAVTRMAGEFEYGWTRNPETGQKTFHVGNVDLSSGGYRPREYEKKFREAENLIKSSLNEGLAS